MGKAKIMSSGGVSYLKNLKDAQVINAISVDTDTIERGEYIENVAPDITSNEKVQTLMDISSSSSYAGYQSTCFIDDTRAITMIICYVGSSSYAVEVGVLTLTESADGFSASLDGVVSIRTLSSCYINPGNVRLKNGNVVFMFGDYNYQHLVTVNINSDNSIEIVEAAIHVYGNPIMHVTHGNAYSLNLVDETTVLVTVAGNPSTTGSDSIYACLLDIQNRRYKSNWVACQGLNNIPWHVPVYQISQDTFMLALFEVSGISLQPKYSTIHINHNNNTLDVNSYYDAIISVESNTSLIVLDPVITVKDGIVYAAYSYTVIYNGKRFYGGIEQMLKLDSDNKIIEMGKYPVAPSPMPGSYNVDGNPIDRYRDIKVGNCIYRTGLSFRDGTSYVYPAIGAYTLNKGLISFTNMLTIGKSRPQRNASALSVDVNSLNDGNTIIIVYSDSQDIHITSIQVVSKITRSRMLVGGVAKSDITNGESGQVLIL